MSFQLSDTIYLDVRKGDTASQLYESAIGILRQGKPPNEDYMASMLYRKDGLIESTEGKYGIDLHNVKTGDRIPLDLNLLPDAYRNVITRARTLQTEKKTCSNDTDRRQLIVKYLEENGIPATASLIDGEDGLEERLTSYNDKLRNSTKDNDSFYIDAQTVIPLLESRMAKHYLSSIHEIGERYAAGESASRIAKDYAVPELQDLSFIRQVGWNTVREIGGLRQYDRHAFEETEKMFADLYTQHGTYKKVQEAMAKAGVKVNINTIGRNVRVYQTSLVA
ncbi:MAG: hypothetical protein ABIJ21_05200 [Nanoarchaeota archaeon]